MLFKKLKRDFDPDLLSLLGLQDVKYWGKGFVYISLEEAAVGCTAAKSGPRLLAAHALLVGSSLCCVYLSASMPFSRVAAQPFLPGWVTRESMTITCSTCSCSLRSSALWSVDNAVLTSLTHLFPTPCIKCIFNYVGRKSHSETRNLPMRSSSTADLLQSHEHSPCLLWISPHLEFITFFPG